MKVTKEAIYTSPFDATTRENEFEGSHDKPQEWVNGCPPVNIECEIKNGNNDWEWCHVKYIGSELCVVDHEGYSDQHYHLQVVKFRPLKAEPTEADKKKEWVLAAGNIADGAYGSVAKLYDALKDGRLGHPKESGNE